MVRIVPTDVGRRVSVRWRLSGDPSGPSSTDAVGRLVTWDGGMLRILRRDGTVAEVAEADLLAGRVIPEPGPHHDRQRRPQ